MYRRWRTATTFRVVTSFSQSPIFLDLRSQAFREKLGPSIPSRKLKFLNRFVSRFSKDKSGNPPRPEDLVFAFFGVQATLLYLAINSSRRLHSPVAAPTAGLFPFSFFFFCSFFSFPLVFSRATGGTGGRDALRFFASSAIYLRNQASKLSPTIGCGSQGCRRR